MHKIKIIDDYLYESEEEEKQTDIKPDKRNHLKKQQKLI